MKTERSKQHKLPPVDADALKRADETLRRMLNTPPAALHAQEKEREETSQVA